MSFSNLILTNRGNDLMGKVVAGGTLQFNRIGIGDGTWPSYDPSMEALVSGRVSFPIQSVVTDNDGLATISAIMLHDHLISVGFYSREIGVFAQDPDLGEILYAMAYAGDEASWIPASTDATAYQHVYTIGINIGTSTSVVVQADPSVVTITLEQMNAHEALELDPTDTDPDKVRHLSNAQANGWETDIAANASAISAHESSMTVHGATSAATPNRIIIRDAAGRAKVSAPSASDDIARKADVDAEVSSRTAADSAHAALTAPHSATSAATANRLMMRDSAGRSSVASGANGDHAVNLNQLNAYVPVGAIFQLFRDTPPSGFLECNGAAISRSTYASLFGQIGTMFGAGNGSTTFNLPDLRGEFLRGWDHGRGIDDGRGMGSWQPGTLVGSYDDDTMGQHPGYLRGGSFYGFGRDMVDPSLYPGFSGVSYLETGGEPSTYPMPVGINSFYGVTRPRNRAVMFCIKY